MDSLDDDNGSCFKCQYEDACWQLSPTSSADCTKCWEEYIIDNTIECTMCNKEQRLWSICHDAWDSTQYRCKDCMEEFLNINPDYKKILYRKGVINLMEELSKYEEKGKEQ